MTTDADLRGFPEQIDTVLAQELAALLRDTHAGCRGCHDLAADLLGRLARAYDRARMVAEEYRDPYEEGALAVSTQQNLGVVLGLPWAIKNCADDAARAELQRRYGLPVYQHLAKIREEEEGRAS